MADTTRNVFSLSDWRSQQVDGEGIDVSAVSLRKGGGGPRTAPNVGYFMGGNRNPGGNSNSYVDKINLSSMTVSASNPTITYTRGLGGKSIGNATHLFYTGGEPNSVSIRDYSTDTSFRIGDASNLESGHGYGGAVSEGTTYGYYVGGSGSRFYGSGPGLSNIFTTKMNYVHGTSYDLPGTKISGGGPADDSRSDLASASNKEAGYFIGGQGSGPINWSDQPMNWRLDKITFSTDTATYLPATTTPSSSGGIWYGAAIGEGTKIYYSGGYKAQTPGNPGNTYNTSTYKITLATDSRSNVPSANLPERARYQATTGSSTIGHFGGGNNGPTLSWIQRLTYSTDTMVHSPARLTRSGEYMGGGSAYENGLSDKKPLEGFDNWLDPAPVATDSQYRPAFSGGGYPQYGWFAAIPGNNGPRVINFASGMAMSAPGAPASVGFSQGSGTNNETHGYLFGGTVSPGPGQRHTQVYKITFATGEQNAGEIQTLYPTQYIPLPSPSSRANNVSALSNPSRKGYFIGGYTPSNMSQWVTMDYFSETMQGTPSSYRNPSIPSQPQLSGSATFAKRDASGYAFAGSNYYKMDFAVDATTIKAKSGGGGGNTSFGGASDLQGTTGYWTGSSDTNFYKLEFATDTISTVGAQANGNAAAMLTGIQGAWFWPQSNSITQRLNFSTETVDMSGYSSPSDRSYAPMSPFNSYSKAANSVPPQAPGTPGFAILKSTGYPDKGYIGTGEGSGNPAPVSSKVDKFTFSTETNSNIPSGAAAGGRRGVAGNTSPTAGYFSGGAYGPGGWGSGRTTDRTPFSNDTPSVLPSATLPDPGKVWYAGSYGNRTHGYRVKGSMYDPNYTSSANDKITYSTNTFQRMAEGSGVYATYGLSTLASLEEGYAAGGEPNVSYMEKFTYQTASASLQPNSFLPIPLAHAGASGTNDKGYIFAGTPNLNAINKFTYKTGTVETTPAQIPGGLNPGPNRITRAGAMSTDEHTYVMGGIIDSWQSNYYKFTHSTDTAEVIPANLATPRGYLEAATASGQGENITYYQEQTNF